MVLPTQKTLVWKKRMLPTTFANEEKRCGFLRLGQNLALYWHAIYQNVCPFERKSIIIVPFSNLLHQTNTKGKLICIVESTMTLWVQASNHGLASYFKKNSYTQQKTLVHLEKKSYIKEKRNYLSFLPFFENKFNVLRSIWCVLVDTSEQLNKL